MVPRNAGDMTAPSAQPTGAAWDQGWPESEAAHLPPTLPLSVPLVPPLPPELPTKPHWSSTANAQVTIKAADLPPILMLLLD